MSFLRWPNKGPDETLDYSIDWTSGLLVDGLDAGDAIVTSVWEVPIALNSSNESNGATSTKIWLSGGVLGADYTLLNTVTTTQARILEKHVMMKIVSK